MSRIYNALRKSDGSQPNMLVQLIDADQEPQQASAVAVAETTQAPGELAAAAVEPAIELAPPPPEQSAEVAFTELPFRGQSTAEMPAEVSSGVPRERPSSPAEANRAPRKSFMVPGQGYRVVPLRIPAGLPILPFDGTDIKAAEQYRLLRTNFLQHPARPKLVAITSATSGDGKTITSINLAATLALKGDRVLIVDADLRAPSVASSMGIEPQPGLGGVLRGACSLEEAIVQVEQLPSLYVLPAAHDETNPTEILDSARCREVFATLTEQFSYVIVDTTPVGTVADFKLVQQLCQGTLMVLRPDNTKRPALLKAMQVELKDKLLGLVVNAYPDWFLWKKHEDDRYYGRSGRKRA
jgi:capsular exopolysaccharide synthesis family protein